MNKNSIYSLNRQFGQAADFYKRNSVSVNVETGATTIDETKYHLQRVAVLPISDVRAFAYGLSFIAANKNFVYGANFDQKSILVIIERKKLSCVVTLNDRLVIKSKNYSIKDVKEFDEGYLLEILEIENSKPEEIQTVKDNLYLSESAIGVVV